MKTCTKCKEEKSKSEFYKDGRRKDGLRPWCKDCCWKASAASEVTKRETRRKFRESKHGKSVAAVNKRKVYQENKEKILTQNASWRRSKRGGLASYKRGANQRNIGWGLTDEQFFKFWQQYCTYCGEEIETIGIDRVDSSKGYTVENTVSCCSTCNKMKLNLTQEEFLGKVKQIVKHIGD